MRTLRQNNTRTRSLFAPRLPALSLAAEPAGESVVEPHMDANAVVAELSAQPPAAPAKPNAVAKTSYTHLDMIDFIIANPHVSQGQLAARYGYTQAWICQVMQSDAWQSLAAERRAKLVDPTLIATIDERFRAMTVRSLERLMEKLDAPVVSDNVVLKAVELGARAMGVGGNAAPREAPTSQDHLAKLANRLIDLQSQRRQGVTYDGQAREVPAADAGAEG